MANTRLFTEKIKGTGKKARWPYDTSLSSAELYNTVMTNLKQQKVGYIFKGWRYNGQIYAEPFDDESTNPFGPITENTDIYAVWSKINVYCTTDKPVVVYEGDTVKVFYHAVTTEIVTSNEVKLYVDEANTTVSYTRSPNETVEGNERVCTFTINENTSQDGKNLVVYAEYKGVRSENLIIYQNNPYEYVIPDSDYFVFNYEWNFDDKGTSTTTDDVGDGIDLDSLTVIYVEDAQGNVVNKSFTSIPVGYRSGYANKSYSHYQVASQNGLLCMKHGGDNRQSGAEGAIICLTNIANSGEVNNLETIKIKIYANWYGRRMDGNMTINCKGYKSKEGSSGRYEDDIIEVSHGNWKTFEVNENNCEVSWEGFSETMNIKAHGSDNARFENEFIEHIGTIYSNVCTVSFNIGTGRKSYLNRTEDNGINRDTKPVYFKNDRDDGTQFTLSTQRQAFDLNNIYFDYWGENGYMFTNDKDYIYLEYYYIYVKKDDPTQFIHSEDYNALTNEEKNNYTKKQPITIKKEDLNKIFTLDETAFLENLTFTQGSDKKLNISFTLTDSNGKKQDVDFFFIKFFDDGIRPAVEERVVILQQDN